MRVCERLFLFFFLSVKEKSNYSRCERLRLISCFHFCSHQSVMGSPLMVKRGRFFSSLMIRISLSSSVNSLLYLNSATLL